MKSPQHPILISMALLLPVFSACGFQLKKAPSRLQVSTGSDAVAENPGETPPPATETPTTTPETTTPVTTAPVDPTNDPEQLPLDECAGIVDECPVEGGVTWNCKKRFVHGVNFAWHHFSGDFGGIPAFSELGVSATEKEVDQELADMKAHGASVIRWWVFPDFRSDGVSFDANDVPTGLGKTVEKDLQKALELAEKNDVYLMLTIFSFDNFKKTYTTNGVTIRGMQPMMLDPLKREALLEKVVRPLAKIGEASPYKKRLMTWELINEPEWAMAGKSKYGGPDYECSTGNLQCVSHEELESFLLDMKQVIRSESKALISVGGAAIKWRDAWKGLDLDYLQYHIYEWVNDWYPYTKSVKDWKITDKPVVMGEYPVQGVGGVDANALMSSWYKNGFGGSLAWAVTDGAFDWNGNRTILKTFSDNANSCTLHY